MSVTGELRRSPLDAVHRELGAKMVEFGGWEMPISYPSGTIEEHLVCRREVAVFDVSHLGTVRVSGSDAFDRLQGALTNDLAKIGPGRAQYTHLLNDRGGVVDDIIVWWYPHTEDGDHGQDVFDVMPNASNTDDVLDAVGGDDITATRAVIAVQGPRAIDVSRRVVGGLAEIGRFRVGAAAVAIRPGDESRMAVAGTGYTGESGIEVSVPVDDAEALWSALVDAGATPAGLGARDTLRLEAGLPLHGHELGPDITPLQAGLGWVVGWDKPGFIGRDALVAERDRGVERRLAGVVVEGRRPPREGSAVFVDDAEVGVVTSGNYSPVRECGIALAFLPPSVEVGQAIEIDVRGKRLPGSVAPLPFV